MITFEELVLTKDGLNKVEELNNRIQKTPNATNLTNHINSSSMRIINNLLGKYFNSPKKVVLKQISAKTQGYYGYGDRVEFSKAGIGFVTSWSKNNTPFSQVVEKENSFVKLVLEDPVVFDAAKKCMSEEGIKILDIVKKVYEENKIKSLEQKEYTSSFKISNSEMNIFDIKSPDVIMCLYDSGEIEIDIYEKASFKKDYWHRDKLIDYDDIRQFKEVKNLIYGIFVNEHINEFDKLINEYENITAPQIQTWQKFDTALKQKLAKYLILEKI